MASGIVQAQRRATQRFRTRGVLAALALIGVAFVAAWLVEPAPASAQAGGVDWTQLGTDIDGVDRDESGESVAMSADGLSLIHI